MILISYFHEGVSQQHIVSSISISAVHRGFLDKAQVLEQTLFEQGYVAPMLKLLLYLFHGRHLKQVYRYEISFGK